MSGDGPGDSPNPLEVQPANASSAQPANARAAPASPRSATLEAPFGMETSPARGQKNCHESLGPTDILALLPTSRAV
jgi:hypothetical protein